MLDELNNSLSQIITTTEFHKQTLALIVLLPWLVHFCNFLLHKRLLLLGIFPRRIYGLPGILFAPLLHADFNHLFFNSIPLVVLSDFVLINGIDYYLWVTLSITLISGLLIWCFGKPGLHVGASALITGYWGLLVSNIVQQGTFTAIILGVICLYYFAGIFYGLFPSQKRVSWEGHVFGLIAGICVSYIPIYLFLSGNISLN